MTAVTSQFEGVVALAFPDKWMSDEQFFAFCQLNRDVKIERNAQGEIIITSPTGSETGNWNSEFNGELGIWNRKHQLGKTFDSSAGFKLPNGATYGPDAAWIRLEKWNALTPDEKKKFAPIVPDFIMELRSPSDRLESIQEKIAEFMERGCLMAWLIDPEAQQTTVYRADGSETTVLFAEVLSGEDVLPWFRVQLGELFEQTL
jgi:Uma2 family endonuclease